MELNDYQKKAMFFAKYKDIEYPFLALCEEVGEVQGKLAKYVRKNQVSVKQALTDAAWSIPDQDKTKAELREALLSELGDVFWQFQACCSELNLELEDVARFNLMKLGDRNQRGVIVGEGDKR